MCGYVSNYSAIFVGTQTLFHFSGETLLRCGKNLMETDSAAVNGIINALQSFADSSKSAKPLVSPIIKLHEKPEDAADSNECREVGGSLPKEPFLAHTNPMLL